MKYTPTIGLEIHAELKTRTKMFCNSKNDPDEKQPNVNVCPVCMGHPGTLPVINREAVKHVLKIGSALGGELADFSEFDRKNYFYPDQPKGYQISQYKYPLVSGGSLNSVAITRVHLEEDTARSIHTTSEKSLIDFNRAGIPLMELVTEPVITNAQDASAFAKELQLLLRYLGAGDAQMERGQMRVEANISVSRDNKKGTKVEVKNLNSFKSVERAIAYEVARQTKVLEDGGEIVQETRGWNEQKQETFSQRIKEDSHDYRYLPDPDLPKLFISDCQEFNKVSLKNEIGELPWEKRDRYRNQLGIKSEDVEFLIQNPKYRYTLETYILPKFSTDTKALSLAINYLTSDVVGISERTGASISALNENFVALIKMVISGDLSSKAAKEILTTLLTEGGDPQKIQKHSEGELVGIVVEVIGENATVVDDFLKGKEPALQYLIGQGMKKGKGSANPEVLKKLFIENIAKK
jgi:aspartyl-tRNA(Asn)/glutamyl-tRNA(Gln) amidotransferase subunit B